MYKPLQLTLVNDFSSVVQYQEFLPSPILKQYISSYFVYKSIIAPHNKFKFRCIPDGCVALTINCLKYERFQLLGTQSAMLISGTSHFDEPIETFGIQFLPGSFHIFFPNVLKEFTDKTIPMHDIVGNYINELESKIFSAQSVLKKVNIAEEFLLNKLAKNTAIDKRLFTILDQIYAKNGQISIEKNFSNCISPRQLRRLFDLYIGISPKKFTRIIRIQSALRNILDEPKQTRSEIYLKYGYYDQSHFIHECKLFLGDPPMSINFNS